MPACSQTTAAGKPCRGYAVKGSDRCSAHLGRGRWGRESTITPELVENLVTMLRAGNYLDVALLAVGLPRRTYRKWLERGESDRPGDAVYRDFRERVVRARAMGETRNVAEIAAAARENWQAAAWLLERSAPERWGRVSVRYRDPEDTATPVETPIDPDDPFREVDELAERRTARRA